MQIPRPEYPRPQFVRPDWLNLNGTWSFETDNGQSGRARGLPGADGPLAGEIAVPFCPESHLSGVANTDFMRCVWYRRTFTLPSGWRAGSRRTLLHIGACDYETEVWVNGASIGTHRGGYTSFSFDATGALRDGDNVITVCAEDDVRDPVQPTGKQSTRYHSYGCLYTRTTGIWQTVWLENVSSAYIANARYTPCLDVPALLVEADCVNADGKTLTVRATYGGAEQGTVSGRVCGRRASLMLRLNDLHLWDIGSPNLYDLTLNLESDVVESYFGMRSVAAENGCLFLNGKPLFQRLVLDQGFYPDGLYTAPDDAALSGDIQLSLDMGFNGARLHEKIFEPRFLTHCDRMGYIVWGEYPNWGVDLSLPGAWRSILPEWGEAVRRDYNHPALVGWCPFNETPKTQDEALLTAVVTLTRALDRTRPVIDTSGYHHVAGLSDILCTHDYEQDPVKFKEYYDNLAFGPIECKHSDDVEQYTFISEYGGIWWSEDDPDGWGYGQRPTSLDEMIERFRGLTEALQQNPAIHALCYTQLTDIEQEQNGLYTYERVPKMDPAIIRAILTQR
ncbi:MAG: beta galactosidase jelly roll domain-containing protein [Oscillospiraceae bacterium]|nr:beta galactosidase jelly roll domain-containing protein [Oscillospiraceae bacterium]